MKKDPLSFEEYEELVKEAGIDPPGDEAEVKRTLESDFRLGKALSDVTEELLEAIEKYPSMRSAHEGYGVLTEEFKELEAHVFTKQGGRDIQEMRREACQVAAMAIRFMADICHDEAGQN